MEAGQFDLIAKETKEVFFPSMEKHELDTAELGNFIDDITKIYAEYFDKGISPMDAGDVLVQISIAAVMKNQSHVFANLFAKSVRNSGDIAVKAIEQHCGSRNPKDWIMD